LALFAYISGTIQSKEMTTGPSDRLVVDVGGIGLEIHVARRTLLTLAALGERVTIPTALAIKETEWTIFGFQTPPEKELFRLLQTVSGIGPKLALALIGTFQPSELIQAILREDQKLISQAPGVGSKVAQRIILELKSRAEQWHEKLGNQDADTDSPLISEASSILTSLGYTPSEVGLALEQAKAAKADDDVESLVKYSLKALGTQ
jgi:Holliday junction DNA helicase RuvA